MKTISTPIGPYSQAKVVNGMLYASGQIPINPATGDVDATTIEGQTEQVIANIAAVLEEAGSSFDNVVFSFSLLAIRITLQQLRSRSQREQPSEDP